MGTTVKAAGHTETVLMHAPLAKIDKEMLPVEMMAATNVSR